MYSNVGVDKHSDSIWEKVKKDIITSLLVCPLALFIYFFLLGSISDSSARALICLIVVAFPVSALRVYRKLKAKSKLIVETKDSSILLTGSLYINNTNDWSLLPADLMENVANWNRLIKLKRRECYPIKATFRRNSLDEDSVLNEDPNQAYLVTV